MGNTEYLILCISTLFSLINPLGFLPIYLALTDKYNKSQRNKILKSGILTALLTLIIFAFLTLKWLKSYTNHGAFVEVPNLVGLSLNDAEITLDNFDLRTQVQDSSNYNPKYPSGAVIEQEPLAGEKVKENRKI